MASTCCPTQIAEALHWVGVLLFFFGAPHYALIIFCLLLQEVGVSSYMPGPGCGMRAVLGVGVGLLLHLYLGFL